LYQSDYATASLKIVGIELAKFEDVVSVFEAFEKRNSGHEDRREDE